MKKLLSILAGSFLMVGMIACDVIEEPYLKDNTGNQGGAPGETPVAVVKNVLLEDYTGVRCPNCPEAGELALDIQEQYGHQVIVLSVHAGSLSAPQPGNFPDFLTNEGTTWYTHFGFTANPIGTINRKLNGSSVEFNKPEWAEAVATAVTEEAVLDMTPTVEYNDANRALKVNIDSKALVELPDTYSLVVCIMEDSIVGKQLINGVGLVEDYMHRHVFRGTINGAWGEEINTEAIAPEDVITKEYTTTLNEAFNADQCYIIAYVANSESKEILQVVEKKIK